MELIKSRGNGFTIKEVAGSAFPSKVICVAFGLTTEIDEQGKNEVHSFDECRLLAATLRESQYAVCDARTIFRKDAFWVTLWEMMSGGGSWNLYCYNLYHLLSLVSFDRCVTSGLFSLDIEEKLNSSNSTSGKTLSVKSSIVLEDPPSIVGVKRRGGGRLTMLDLRNYGLSPNETGTDSLENECGCVLADVGMVVSFLRDNDLGSIKNTSASQSFNIFRRNYMNHKIHIHPFLDVAKLERSSYYGGRCECYRIGLVTKPVTLIDVNAMYPFLMSHEEFPTRLVGYNEIMSVADLADALRYKMGIAEVTIKTDSPLLPYRDDRNTIWPVGEFKTALAHSELVVAINNQLVTKVHKVALYDSAPIFAAMMEDVFKWRNELGKSIDIRLKPFIKNIAMMLYGKIGQSRKEWLPYPIPLVTERWEMFWTENPVNALPCVARSIDGILEWLSTEGEPELSFPAIPACLCSSGRCMLNWLIGIVGRDNVLYCDTDSLMIYTDSLHKFSDIGLINQSIPGRLKIVEQADECHIWGWKYYSIGNKTVCAGEKGRQQSFFGKSPAWLEWIGFKQSMWNKDPFSPVSIFRQHKHRKPYKLGVVKEDGHVEPFHYGEAVSNELGF